VIRERSRRFTAIFSPLRPGSSGRICEALCLRVWFRHHSHHASLANNCVSYQTQFKIKYTRYTSETGLNYQDQYGARSKSSSSSLPNTRTASLSAPSYDVVFGLFFIVTSLCAADRQHCSRAQLLSVHDKKNTLKPRCDFRSVKTCL